MGSRLSGFEGSGELETPMLECCLDNPSAFAAQLGITQSSCAVALPVLAHAYRQRFGRNLDKPFELLLLYDQIPDILKDISLDLPVAAQQELKSCMQLLPQRCLPAVGLGTFNLFSEFSSHTCNSPIAFAYENGCRMFDFFDPPDGGVLAVENDIPRIGEELRGKDLRGSVLISKPDFLSLSRKSLRAQFLDLLTKLGLQDTQRGRPIIDLYIMHFPFMMMENMAFAPAGEIDTTWKEMEKLVDGGLVRCLGVSNFSKQQLNKLMSICRIKPVVHQFEQHPFCQNPDMVHYCHANGIACIASIPLAKGSILSSKYLRHAEMSPAQCALRWNLQQGVSVIPGAQTEDQILENLAAGRCSEAAPDIPDLGLMMSKMEETFPKMYKYMAHDGLFTQRNGHMYCTTAAEESRADDIPEDRVRIVRQVGNIVSLLRIADRPQKRRANICKMLRAQDYWKDLSEMLVIPLPAFEELSKSRTNLLLSECSPTLRLSADQLDHGARILYISDKFLSGDDDLYGTAYRKVVVAAKKWAENESLPQAQVMLWLCSHCIDHEGFRGIQNRREIVGTPSAMREKRSRRECWHSLQDEGEKERRINSLGLYILCCDGFISIDTQGYWDQAWARMEIKLGDSSNIPRYIFNATSEHEDAWSLVALEVDDVLRTKMDPSSGTVEIPDVWPIIHMQLAIAKAIQGRLAFGDMTEPSTVLEEFNPAQVRSLRELRRALEERNHSAFLEARSACSKSGVPAEHLREVEQQAKTESDDAGINVTYIISDDFMAMARDATGKTNPTFQEMSNEFFLSGSMRVGEGLLCPRDLRVGCSFLDTLPKRYRKRATHFISWVWGYSLHTVRGCLQRWVAAYELQPGDLFGYMCFFCNNQWRILVEQQTSGCQDLEVHFEKRLSDIGNMVALMDEWRDPLYTKRIWTIFEQYTAVKLKINVHFTLPEHPAQTLLAHLDQGKEGFRQVIAAIAKIDAVNAKATFQEDEDKVKSMIRAFGPATVNAAVKQSIVEWVGKEFKANFQGLLKASASGSPSPRRQSVSL